MRFSRTRWFTLWEILVVVVVISIGLLSIVSLLTYSLNFVQKSRQRVIAINLAREWIEAVYQIRDTNRQRRAGRKDQCWLKINPLVDENAVWCRDDTRMLSGSYLLTTNVVSGQQYFLLTGYSLTTSLSLASGISTWALQYALCQSGGLWIACPGSGYVSPEWRYFREIRWYGLYAKDVSTTWWSSMSCTSGASNPCGSSSAKEFRFCSKVAYVWYGTWEVQLCGVITDFAQK